ncbi:metal-dependent transcriptional regulator [Aerococcus sanguinicola]|uniref:metal-dependent transcriptional regulator n=1 Tax=unclassified Aerococcus TaxID=2618060 RepID=UPI0008A37E8F|nr:MULTISPECIES: metal-dependent transcriptional regulator [unclassified Aerococcus]MDK6232862.1 metal-dependent transcriptional regulator [Aerococcus sp. UMB10185]MDK6805187.1 metal-dependent transcriptional regulator [Aerococcus sp. UMB7834]MDK6855752.1 metal-dependent transcriptional regulator [Aerococcus sp. UMB7533]MDK8502492.1 metal-dependent transcriptional regulator [Aerococcus sp. UMB1112A]
MSRSKDDYMKAIYQLKGDERNISNKEISQALHVSAASVTEMLNKLQAEGYLVYVPYQGVRLTEEGSYFASQIIRRHRLWEVFLHDELRYPWDEVHPEAEVLEHYVSDDFINRLEAYLGYPKYCPHGGAIPDQEGHSEHEAMEALANINLGTSFIVRRVVDDDQLLAYLDEHGLRMNKAYELVDREAYSNDLVLKDLDQGQSLRLNAGASQNIFVEVSL